MNQNALSQAFKFKFLNEKQKPFFTTLKFIDYNKKCNKNILWSTNTFKKKTVCDQSFILDVLENSVKEKIIKRYKYVQIWVHQNLIANINN